jgi:Bacterial toxin 46
MAGYKIQGSVCTVSKPGAKTVPAIGYVPPGASYSRPGSVRDSGGLTPEQEELALDIAQLTLDIVGVFEPTPFADGTNALISIARGDWLGAGLSGISIIPYIGDLAKTGKLPSYAQKLHRAIELARQDANFARYLSPALYKMKSVLDTIPDNLSPRVQSMVDTIKRPLESFIGRTFKVARMADIDAITDRLLIARLGSTKNVGGKRANVKKAAEYFIDNHMSEEQMVKVLGGIDISSPVEIVDMIPGDVFIQYVDASQGVGNWWVKAGSGSGSMDVGLATGHRKVVGGKKIAEKHERNVKTFEVISGKQPGRMLKSRAAPVVDTWSPNAISSNSSGFVRKPGHHLVTDPYGRIDISSGTAKITADRSKNAYGVMAPGGGEQYYLAPVNESGIYDKEHYKKFFQAIMPNVP